MALTILIVALGIGAWMLVSVRGLQESRDAPPARGEGVAFVVPNQIGSATGASAIMELGSRYASRHAASCDGRRGVSFAFFVPPNHPPAKPVTGAMLCASVFFSLSSWAVALIIFAVVGSVAAGGVLLGRRLRQHHETLREPFGVLQAALLGVVGLILAFGLTLAVGRYEDRRAAVVAEANAIGTTYLRAQLLSEPVRTRSLAVLRSYTDLALHVSREVPNSGAMKRTIAAEDVRQRRLWSLAGQAVDGAPIASAPRLYVDSLNTMIDQQTVRISALNNRVPGSVLALEVIGASLALGLLALYLSVVGRGLWPMALATLLVTMLLLVTFDLDRPTRGLITIPNTPYVSLRASMALPPAASPR